MGLPSPDDPDDLATMFADWKNNRKLVDDVVLTNEQLGVGKYFLHEYVFKIWRKLSKRIFLEKCNTTYGVTNGYFHREDRLRFKPQQMLGPGTLKFPPTLYNSKAIKKFGEFISLIPGTNGAPENFGEIYYTATGHPTPNNTGNSKLNTLFQQSNNIVIVSNLRNNGIYGVNAQYIFSETVSPNIITQYRVHRSTIAGENELTRPFNCVINSQTGPTKYFQSNLRQRSKTNLVRNTIVHEFSHNYLLDEYSNSPGDLSSTVNDRLRNIITTETKDSNVQVGKDLETASNFIDGNEIKWNWPRIKKIGLGDVTEGIKLVTGSADTYECKIQTNAINKNIKEVSFQNSEEVLLRKRYLFDTSTSGDIKCSIESVDDAGDYTQKIKLKPTSPIVTTDYDEGFIIILPHIYRDNNTDHVQKLVHHTINNAITTTNYGFDNIQKPGRPMVIEENVNNNTPQQLDPNFLQWPGNFVTISKFKTLHKFKIVGLYAGGSLSFRRGIYHSTGFCAMRGFFEAADKKEQIIYNGFCPVCTYILIDHIDPLKHPSADDKYGEYVI